MTYIIALPCVDVMDRTRADRRSVDCVYEDERTPYIHPDECIDYGACEPVCPVEVIYHEDDLPKERSVFESVNAEFFDGIGSPGDTQCLGPVGGDRPYITGLSPRRE